MVSLCKQGRIIFRLLLSSRGYRKKKLFVNMFSDRPSPCVKCHFAWLSLYATHNTRTMWCAIMLVRLCFMRHKVSDLGDAQSGWGRLLLDCLFMQHNISDQCDAQSCWGRLLLDCLFMQHKVSDLGDAQSCWGRLLLDCLFMQHKVSDQLHWERKLTAFKINFQ